MAQMRRSLHLECGVLVNKGIGMNAFSTAAALIVLAATTAAFSAQTQEQPPARGSSEPGAASCQLKREAMQDTAASAAFAATVAQDGMVEVALAGLVLRKSGDNQLRLFAQKM